MPEKNDLAKQLWDVVTTLTPEAQNAGLRKAEELAYDLTRGRIPLAETLINLNHAREVLLDIVEKNKLIQLPLKIQYSLLAQAQRVGQSLQALIGGTDTVVAIEDSVDDLNSSIWQYNLQNLSGQVLGFTQKMNELKRQETLIREARRQADAFSSSRIKAEEILSRLRETGETAEALSNSISESSKHANSSFEQISKDADSSTSKVAEIDELKNAADVSVKACQTAAEEASKHLAETDAARKGAIVTDQQLKTLLESTAAQFNEDKERTTALLSQIAEDCETVSTNSRNKIEESLLEFTGSINELREKTEGELSTAVSELASSTEQLKESITTLISDSEERLTQSGTKHAATLKESLDQFDRLRSLKLEEVSAEFQKAASEIESHARETVTRNDQELSRLTKELDSLELKIRDSINRATGFTLFHSFQKRQEALSKSKRAWAIALGVTVGLSLCASGWFIWSLQFVHEYNAAFYLKLSISLPIIYAIAFCNLQYSRERSLEEEYAFKSSISISLDPYQKLVKSLIDDKSPDELAKYTGFLIESVNRVFTPPVSHPSAEGSTGGSPEKIIQALQKFLDPVLALIKK